MLSKKLNIYVFACVLTFCCTNISPENTIPQIQNKNEQFTYNLEKPVWIFYLPDNLKEISGISFYKTNLLAAVQDEKGTIFLLDVEKQKVIRKIKFAEKGNFEDLQIVGENCYVLDSKGLIYEIENFDSDNRRINQYDTPLTEKNNAEGMCFDATTNSLLIACKGSAQINEKVETLKNKRAIYRFALKTKELIPKPAFVLNPADFNSTKHNEAIDYQKHENDFRPSAIGIQPVTKNIFVLASVGKKLIVLNNEYKVLYSKYLDKKMFNQPEGICFSPDGDLFISSEGKKSGKGYILKFSVLN